MVTFDPEKNRRNVRDRGISFERADAFVWRDAVVETDARRDYGEHRYVATGTIDGRLHVLVFTARDHDIRVISLRRANPREQAAYAARRTRSVPDR